MRRELAVLAESATLGTAGINLPGRLTMNALQWLNSLRPALPMSVEQPGTQMSNGELRRHMRQGGVLVNAERVAPDEPIDFPAFSLVFFPKSNTKRTTLL